VSDGVERRCYPVPTVRVGMMRVAGESRLETHASRGVLLLGALVGITSFAYYYLNGLSTAHFEAKAHLVIARRLIDSPSPGYAQMGAQWLPLIHILYLPFVMFNSQYRTALMPSLLSVCAFAVSGWLVYRIAVRMTGSTVAGIFAAVVLIGNPNLQFLQSAPMTEPIYLVLALLAMDSFLRWRERGKNGFPWQPALWAAIAAMCRYEGWLFVGGVIALTAYEWWSRQISRSQAFRTAGAFLGVFAVPAILHFGFIYLRVGDSFFQVVARGNPLRFETYKRPFLSIFYNVGEFAQAAAIIPLVIGISGVIYCLLDRKNLRRRLPYFLPWSAALINVSALYWGLMYRVRYSALLVPAVAIFGSLVISEGRTVRRVMIICCLAVFVLPWVSWAFPHEWAYHFTYASEGILLLPAAALVLLLTAVARRSYSWPLLLLALLSMHVPVLEGEYHAVAVESREHEYIEPEQRQLLEYWSQHYDGRRILIDQGRLAPLMYDSKIPLKEFVCHDGGSRDWDRAISSPRIEVGWMCAEKGDEIWELLQVDPHRADGYSLAVKTEHYVIYKLSPERRGDEAPARQLP
jgi:hypothetical protein